MTRLRLLRGVLIASTLCLCAPLVPAAAGAAPPANDARAHATPLPFGSASATGSTTGATAEPDDPAICGETGSVETVWYRLRAPADSALVLFLDAGGQRDAAVAVFEVHRSRLQPLGCVIDDTSGQAAMRFVTRRGLEYLIGIAPDPRSSSGPFRLRVLTVAPPVLPPGKPLPERGIWGVLDPLRRLDAAWSATLEAGRTYRLAAWTFSGRLGECPDVELFAPPVRRFHRPTRTVSCRGYRLFTPRPGQEGRWVVRVRTSQHAAPRFRYHLVLQPALADDSAPGTWLPERTTVRGTVAATGIDRVDLYRFSVPEASELSAFVRLPLDAQGNLELRRDDGKRLACACEGSGPQSLRVHLPRGRYYLAVQARGANPMAYALGRVVRAITSTRAHVDGARSGGLPPGAPVQVSATVTPPPRGGRVSFTVERLDPLAGWLFVRQNDVSVGGTGRAVLRLRPLPEGRYRVVPSYRGTASSGASRGAQAQFLVGAPLRPASATVPDHRS